MPAPHHPIFYRPDALPATQQRQSTEGHKALKVLYFDTDRLFTSMWWTGWQTRFPAPLKLRPYGAIQICLLLLFF